MAITYTSNNSFRLCFLGFLSVFGLGIVGCGSLVPQELSGQESFSAESLCGPEDPADPHFALSRKTGLPSDYTPADLAEIPSELVYKTDATGRKLPNMSAVLWCSR